MPLLWAHRPNDLSDGKYEHSIDINDPCVPTQYIRIVCVLLYGTALVKEIGVAAPRKGCAYIVGHSAAYPPTVEVKGDSAYILSRCVRGITVDTAYKANMVRFWKLYL